VSRKKGAAVKKIIGVVLIVAGVAFGIYVGIWLMFIGGIFQVIEQVRAVDMSTTSVVIGIVRVMLSGVAGYIACALLIVPGVLLFKSRRKGA